MVTSQDSKQFQDPPLDADRLMAQSNVVLRLGSMMLTCGAGAYRVKSAMARAAAAVGLDRHEAQVTMNEIVASAFVGKERFRTVAVEQRRVGVNVDKLERLRTVVENLEAHERVEDLNAKLDEVASVKPLYGAFANAAASGVACAGFCFLNKGGLYECLGVLIAAFLGQALRRFLLHRGWQHFVTWLLCGLLGSGAYMAVLAGMDLAGITDNTHQAGVISAILFLIPGFPMVTAMLDMIRQDFLSALTRMSYVIMVMAAAGIAVWVTSYVANWPVDGPKPAGPTGLALYSLDLVCSFVAAYGFAMLFNAPARAALVSAITGAVANTGRIILINEAGLPWHLAVGLAALVIGLMAQLFVSSASLSRVALSVPAVVIMIPGVPFYRALSAINDHTIDTSVAVSTAFGNIAEVVLVITAIGAGLALARVITDRNWRHDFSTSSLPDLH